MSHRVIATEAFTGQRQQLWDLCYRITGSVVEADMTLRECFLRAVEQPIVERDVDWGLPLVGSAALLARDALRQRKRRHYVGCWLPSLVETGNAVSARPRVDSDGIVRYDLVESGS